MPELFIELFSEEIPARMQKRAEEDLLKLLREKLEARGLKFAAVQTFSAPRRLGVSITDLPAKAADVNEEKKGPRVGAPEQALQGFLKSAGLTSIDQAQVVDDKKGAFYVARIERAGMGTPAIVQEVLPEIIRQFPWPKSMRSQSSDLQWVRPLHNICCVFDGREVKIDVAGVPSEAATWGHRFHAPAKIAVTGFERYNVDLRAAKVIPLREDRKNDILAAAREQCAKHGFELVEDTGLLEEVSGLAEWPQVIFGDMDPAFLDLPGEVIRLSMRTHQKYFAVRDAKTKKLAPHFITVANISAKDGGKAIAAGNARVLSARLSDARYFWDVDRYYDAIGRTKPKQLDAPERIEKLKQIVFHQKLGSVWDKVERVKALAVELCEVTGADKALVERAATLMKCDLVTEVVGEFPELQGQIGRELATIGKENDSVAIAIEDHYRPLGPNDRVPTDKVAVTLALADKLDTLVAFWSLSEKPTGSGDPYGLRRAQLGVVRTILENSLRMPTLSVLTRAARLFALNSPLERAEKFIMMFDDRPREAIDLDDLRVANKLGFFTAYGDQDEHITKALRFAEDDLGSARGIEGVTEAAFNLFKDEIVEDFSDVAHVIRADRLSGQEREDYLAMFADSVELYEANSRVVYQLTDAVAESLLDFAADRLKVQLRDQGKRHDLVDAVFALDDDDLVRIVARVDALDAFLKTEAGANLLAGYKRAANILAAEEKKGKGLSETDVNAGLQEKLLAEPAEKALYAALEAAIPKARAAVDKEDFAAAMQALADLRAPVDAFFVGVLVNAEDAALRRNRLLLLSRLREALSAVADFSKIEG